MSIIFDDSSRKNGYNIAIDTETGVNYIIGCQGMHNYSICPRYSSDGNIYVSTKEEIDNIIKKNNITKHTNSPCRNTINI